MKRKRDQEFRAEQGPPEFNQMALYLVRLDRRSDERDLALNSNNVISLYTSTLTLLMNCIPRFEQKGMNIEDIDTLNDDIMKLGNKVQSLIDQHSKAREKNELILIRDLYNFNIRVNKLMFKYGMVYPEKVSKPLAEIIEEDF
ncbi:MAG: hypothetical protein ACFFG0_19960 [Candidatus Thorarchaeota archaeon]